MPQDLYEKWSQSKPVANDYEKWLAGWVNQAVKESAGALPTDWWRFGGNVGYNTPILMEEIEMAEVLGTNITVTDRPFVYRLTGVVWMHLLEETRGMTKAGFIDLLINGRPKKEDSEKGYSDFPFSKEHGTPMLPMRGLKFLIEEAIIPPATTFGGYRGKVQIYVHQNKETKLIGVWADSEEAAREFIEWHTIRKIQSVDQTEQAILKRAVSDQILKAKAQLDEMKERAGSVLDIDKIQKIDRAISSLSPEELAELFKASPGFTPAATEVKISKQDAEKAIQLIRSMIQSTRKETETVEPLIRDYFSRFALGLENDAPEPELPKPPKGRKFNFDV